MSNPNGINVLSLFDGMSCGQIALRRSGITVNQYFSSEVDKHAIKVTQANYPNTIQLGDVTKWREWDLPQIDLLTFGSPCQGFSMAGKGLNFDDPRSALFFTAVDILKHFKPKWFLMENVRMDKWCENVISDALNVDPVYIDSALVSAQRRFRIYWTNLPVIGQPQDKGLVLDDILETNVSDRYLLSAAKIAAYEKHRIHQQLKHNGSGFGWSVFQHGEKVKSKCLLAAGADDKMANFIFTRQIMQLNPSLESGGKQPYQQNRIYDTNGLSPALCADKSDLWITERLTESFLQEPPHQHGGENRQYRGKSQTMTARLGTGGNNVPYVNNVRKLTEVEVERLQTVPDNYTNHVSSSQRYKMLGNGWTVDVIVWLLSFLDQEPRNGRAQSTLF